MSLEALTQTTRPPSSFLSIAQRKLDQYVIHTPSPEGIASPRRCLELIDRQYVDNLGVYNVPGTDTCFPITHVSVNEIIGQLSQTPQTTDKGVKPHRRISIFFPGFYHSLYLHPLGHGDVMFDRVTALMPEVARSMKTKELIEASVYIWGYPTGVWGKVDPEWTKQLRQHGLAQYGKDLAGFVRSLGIDDQVQFLFHGMSAGVPIAALTAQELAHDLSTQTTLGSPAQLQLLLDNPAGIHTGGFIPGSQIALGFAAEAIGRVIADPTTREMASAIGRSLKDLIPYLEQRGIPSYFKDAGQTKPKQEAIFAGLIGLFKGSPLDTETIHTFIRRGVMDPVSLSAGNIAHVRELMKEHHVSMPFGALGTSHAIDYLRADHVVRRVNQAVQILSDS